MFKKYLKVIAIGLVVLLFSLLFLPHSSYKISRFSDKQVIEGSFLVQVQVNSQEITESSFKQVSQGEIAESNSKQSIANPKQEQVELSYGCERAGLKCTENMTKSEHEEFQQSQVNEFCTKYGHSQSTLINRPFFVLLNQKKQTAYCFTPKVGCTNLKNAFLRAQGVYTSNLKQFNSEVTRHSLKNASIMKQREILNTYYKFMVYRNPAERLFSAYRDKVEKYPMKGLDKEEPHFNWVRHIIYKYKYPDKFQKWQDLGGKEEINITFPEFAMYWIDHDMKDSHFAIIFSICQPCQVHYDYYGKFGTLEQDAEVLMKHMGSDLSLLDDGYYEKKGKTSSELAPEYYGLLSRQQKEDIIRKLSVDLLFYYSIFPEERDSHKAVMDTDIDVPELQ